MSSGPLRNRITDQFSCRGRRADIWRLFDLVLDTDAFLNLGYSEWYQPHFIGSSQQRLALKIGRRLKERLPTTEDVRLLDVGCGRGGPTIHLADRFGFRATGIDLVPYNVARARENATERGIDAEFVVGDATSLPFASGSLPACISIDAFVYLPDREAVLTAIADVLEPGGLLVFSDLLARSGADETEQRAIARFADAWDMPALGNRSEYEEALTDAGFDVLAVEDISSHSVRRFRKWTTLFGLLYATSVGRAVEWLLTSRGLDATIITDQIQVAHDALPSLRHVLFIAQKRGGRVEATRTSGV